jgi:hypothetical protein
MKVQPTTKELIAMLYERLPELFDRAAPVQDMPKIGCVNHDCDRCKAAAQRQWVGLTDEEREEIALEVPMDAVCITEAKLKEKNA